METLSIPPSNQQQEPSNGLHVPKRKRSPSAERTPHSVASRNKIPKIHSGAGSQIDYLSRKYTDNLRLITADDSLQAILSLLQDYEGVMQRHESLANNLGARPLGPILLKRFERLFDGPPKVLKTHGKDGTSVSWLDVVEFAEQKPEQFNLEKMRDGLPVCQFYTKQCRVEISEEDYVLIASKVPQKMIPSQPIAADEEKELGTLEILEAQLGQIVQLADQVEARARQLNHRLKSRRTAIVHRREVDAAAEERTYAPSPTMAHERELSVHQTNGDERRSMSPTAGFVAVNTRLQADDSPYQNGYTPTTHEKPRISSTVLQSASQATKADLMKCFSSQFQNMAHSEQEVGGGSKNNTPGSRPQQPSSAFKPSKIKGSIEGDYPNATPSSNNLIHTTPNVTIVAQRMTTLERMLDDNGIYRADMLLRMDQLDRGERVVPPCDRCRRLHMDCLKNLTACQGCTRKHAKCSWKDVTEQELIDNPFVPRAERTNVGPRSAGDGSGGGGEGLGGDGSNSPVEEAVRGPVRDEELLGEEGSDDDGDDDSGVVRATQRRTMEPREPLILPVALPEKIAFPLTKPQQDPQQSTEGRAYMPKPRVQTPSDLTAQPASLTIGNLHATEQVKPEVPQSSVRTLYDPTRTEDALRHRTSTPQPPRSNTPQPPRSNTPQPRHNALSSSSYEPSGQQNGESLSSAFNPVNRSSASRHATPQPPTSISTPSTTNSNNHHGIGNGNGMSKTSHIHDVLEPHSSIPHPNDNRPNRHYGSHKSLEETRHDPRPTHVPREDEDQENRFWKNFSNGADRHPAPSRLSPQPSSTNPVTTPITTNAAPPLPSSSAASGTTLAVTAPVNYPHLPEAISEAMIEHRREDEGSNQDKPAAAEVRSRWTGGDGNHHQTDRSAMTKTEKEEMWDRIKTDVR
ncbi:hypothetical protein MMC25_004017 [Agyrium rufum]|nr:hypothetical protein [Agyrium rufum]